ncbi:hypothetical protein MAR_034404, partial [Mya arenaria]
MTLPNKEQGLHRIMLTQECFKPAIGHWSVYLWMFISNMCYAIMFGYSWYIWAELREYYYNDVHNYYFFNVDEYNSMALLDTVFAFTLIITFFLSMLNLYSFSLVYKYGCCFMNEVDRDHSQQSVETAVVMNKEISTIGGGLPVNVSVWFNVNKLIAFVSVW